MRRFTLFLLVFWLAEATSYAGTHNNLAGAWIQKQVKWIDVPAHVTLNEQVGNAAILYFRNDHSFALIYCTVGRVRKEYVISGGDPREVYQGQWNAQNEIILVSYRAVEKTLELIGEKLPGPMKTGRIKIMQRPELTLVFEGKTFRRETALDKSAADAASFAPLRKSE